MTAPQTPKQRVFRGKINMNYKKITLEDMYKVDELISQAEEILRNSLLDDESYLLNHIRNYIRIKRQVLG